MSRTERNSNESVTPSRRLSSRRRERGVALLMTIFGLLLLTALAAAMMFSSDSETAISVNYRDSQISGYSAASGLQEARDRIHPIFGDLAIAGYLPTNTPDQGPLNGGYVLYIVNPKPNETVAGIAPWNWNGGNNPYFDQELCQENMFPGIVTPGAPGVACAGASAVPPGGCTNIVGGGANWCRYYDNSANASNWQLKDAGGNAIPLDYKWVRVSMKEDWNTPAHVASATGAAASGQQVCWDGNYQTQRPANYNPATCYPTGGNSVIGLNLTAAGSNFITAPTVTITGGGGSGATATAQIAPAPSDGIATVVITNGGSGYTSPPTVTISPSGATFQAAVASSAVTGVNINSGGSNYCYASANTPVVNFSTTPGTNTISNATATVTMNSSAGCISGVSNPGTKCTNTTPGKAYAITGSPSGGGSGFAGTAIFGSNHKISSITVTNVGSGYASGGATVGITDDGGTNCSFGLNTTSFTTGNQIGSITIGAGNGGAYMSQPSATLGGTSPAAPVSPALPTLTALPNPWSAAASSVSAVNVTSAGTGYTPGTHYPLTFTGGGGTGAAGYAVGGGTFVVSGLTLTNGGAGYTSAPTVTITPAPGDLGSGATGTATIAVGGVNTSMGQIYVVTSFAMTRTGSKSMAQMETGARPPFTFNLGGAITLPGTEPAANFVSPNSNNLIVNGNDAAGTLAADPPGCSGKSAAKPAIGVWDSQSQTNVISDLGKPQNFTGSGGTPSVEVVYAALGGEDVTPSNLDTFVSSLQSYVTSPVLTGSVSSLPATTTSSVTYVDGDLSLSGNVTGNGVLVVTGTLTLSGNFTWNGIVLVVGQGKVVHDGGGNGDFNGAIYVAQTKDASGNQLSAVGSPQYTWNGGGTNQIQYDHCLADGLLQAYEGKPSNSPLQVLSMRTLQF
jgi:hypothetical protein